MTDYLRKYFIMGSQNCHREPEIVLREAIDAGITAFQFREKGIGSLNGKEKVELGKRLRELCRDARIPFFINDDVELATLLDVDGIHIGQEDMKVEKVREKFPDLLLGLSVSNLTELENSPLHLVDYVGAGPVYDTVTKDDAKAAVGLEWITYIRKHYPKLPIVGIGGINTSNSSQVMEAGANGVSVISVIAQSKDIAKTVQAL